MMLIFSANFGILVRRCFAFDETETSVQLVDERGCKDDRVISEFEYDSEAGTAEGTIYSMFRLPHSNRTYFQCDVAICRGECPKPSCKESVTLKKEGESLKKITIKHNRQTLFNSLKKR